MREGFDTEEYWCRFASILATVELVYHTTRVTTGRNRLEPRFKERDTNRQVQTLIVNRNKPDESK